MKYITAGQINNFNFDEVSQLENHIEYIPNSIDEYIVILQDFIKYRYVCVLVYVSVNICVCV